MTDRSVQAGEVLAGIGHGLARGAGDEMAFSSIEFDSRACHEGSLFFCVPGIVSDGHDFAPAAAANGASALVVERELDLDLPQFVVGDARRALALGSANFYGNPSSRLKLVGITGTNGKTTTSFLVEHIARACGAKTGLMGTVECHVGDEVRPSIHTTPESRDLQALLADMVDAGVDVAALEVSSQGLDMGRLEGTRFAVSAFTNLTQDHLDFHKTMENYFLAKARLFTELESGVCVICVDDEYGRRMARLAQEHGREVVRVSAEGDAAECEVGVVSAEYAPHSTRLGLDVRGQDIALELPLVGRFNVENCVVAFGIGLALGYPADDVATALATAPQVPGRLERVTGTNGRTSGFGVLVDYAHTPDSVAKAIAAVKAVTPGKVICVFGCGGDRDHGKRPKMGRAALSADYAIVTSDNPRTEDPDAIIAMILPGMEGHEDAYEVVPDRRQAIFRALALAQPGDAVLIAGKGHEDYQIVGTEKRHFDDREVAAEGIDAL